jgi:DNA-binding XRE family transcriptional regulator
MAKMTRPKPRSPFGQRMYEARTEAGLSQESAAGTVGMSQSALSDAEGVAAGCAYTAQLASLYKVNPVWLATGQGRRELPTVLLDFFLGRHGALEMKGIAPPDQSVAHIVSLDKSTVLAPTDWETLMDLSELPLQYAALMPDDAIDEVVARGTYLAFDRGLKPRPGDKVAVRCGGLLHVRIYEQTVGGWIGRATRKGYTSFDSTINLIEVAGVVSLTGRAPE